MLKKIVLLSFFTLLMFQSTNRASGIEVESLYDFQLAVQYALTNNIDTLYLSTSGGVYTTTDTNYFLITSPLSIVAKPGLAEKPIITHSDANQGTIEIFRIMSDFNLDGVILDGGHEQSHGLKYGIRAGDVEDFPPAAPGYSIRVKNTIFRNFYQDKDLAMAGHAVYFLKGVDAGTVKLENCKFENFGDEAIRMAETEKYEIDRCLDSLIIRNCSFTNIDAECIRFYADVDTLTQDAYLLLENITVNRSATRMLYVKNNKNTIVRNILVTNSRLPAPDRAERADYVMQIQMPGSTISHVDTLNMIWGQNASETKIASTKGGSVDKSTIFAFDPDYEDEANFNLVLKPTSHAYYSGLNNTHLGDLNNAINTPQVSPLNLEIEGKGSVVFNPERLGLTFVTGQVVILTAVPDEGYAFKEWSGDLSGSNLVESITVDGFKNVKAVFEVSTGLEDDLLNVTEYSLSQNYPNPFNPSTLVTFSLAEAGQTTLRIFDVLGKEISVALNKELSAGKHSLVIDGKNLTSGLYFYQIQSGNFISTKKMMLVK